MSGGLFEYSGFALPSWTAGSFGSAESLSSLESLVATGSTSISIVATSYITTANSHDFHSTESTEPDLNVCALIRQAHSLGLEVLLKPHVDALDGSAFRGEFAPVDAAAWFAGYKDLILRYAQIAASEGVKALCVGCEYDNLIGPAYRSQWIDLIESVRAIYGGVITYAATAASAKDVSFWDAVDLIGVNAYYRMSESTSATVQDYIDTWTSVPTDQWELSVTEGEAPIDFLRSLALHYEKPLFLAEIGYRSVDEAAVEPGIWNTQGSVDLQEQVNLYLALFEVLTAHGGDWFAGLHLWNWDVVSWGTNNTAYSPQDKPALQVVTDWFTGTATPSGLTFSGTNVADTLHGGLGDDTMNAEFGDDDLRGGAGEDLLIGGPTTPGTITRSASTTVVVSAMADVLNGLGARFLILVDGKQVGEIFEAKDQTEHFTVTFDNKDFTASIAVQFINDEWLPGVGDRNLYVTAVQVNSNNLPMSEAVNPTGNGQGAMWFNSILSIDTRSRQDWFNGAISDKDTLFGGIGNDTLVGGAGDDLLNGGEGVDAANFAGLRINYAVTALPDGFVRVADLRAGAPEGTDTLQNVELLLFADGHYALPGLADGTGFSSPPAPPSILSFTADTGISNTDRVTSDRMLVFSGTGEAGHTLEIHLEGGLIGTSSVDEFGRWVMDLSPLALDDGDHVLTAVNSVAGGVPGGASDAFSFTLDTHAPTAPTILQITPDTGKSATDKITSSTFLTLSGIAEAGSDVAVQQGETPVGHATADADGRWSYTTNALADGAHHFVARAIDIAGNTSEYSTPLEAVVDSFAPAARFTGLETTRNMTKVHGVSEAGSTVQVTDSVAKVIGIATAAADGSWSLSLGNLSNSSRSFRVTGTDQAGNTDQEEARLILGSAKADAMLGGGGRDLLIGGTGNDVLTGGKGSDIFLFKAGSGRDRITDFIAGTSLECDQIRLEWTPSMDFATILAKATQVGQDAILNFDVNNSVALAGVSKAALTIENFLFY
jgi:Ca2+-binding RTX toxin-like protein